MSIPLFGGPYIPPFFPVSNITPFTHRDGATYLEILEDIRTFINGPLVEFINTNFSGLGEEFQAEVTRLIGEVETHLDEQDENVAGQIAALTTSVNTAVANVNTQLAAQSAANAAALAAQNAANATALANHTAAVNAALAAQNTANAEALDEQNSSVNTQILTLTEYVNDQVATIIGNSITAQDDVVAGIVLNDTSDTRTALDSLYYSADAELAVTDPAVQSLIDDAGSGTRLSLNAKYAPLNIDPVIAGLLANDASQVAEAVDPRVAEILGDGDSASRILLDGAYAPIDINTIAQDADVYNILNNPVSASRIKTDSLYDKTDFASNAEARAMASTVKALTPANLAGFGLAKGKDSTKYRMVGGVMERTSSTTWALINNANHAPTGVASVARMTDRVRITFDFTASKVVTWHNNLDETFASSTILIRLGASVGLTYADVFFYTSSGGATPIDPGTLSSAGANVWFGGLFEIA